MKLALIIYRYFPFGGLQRDFLCLLQALHQRGHDCRVYTRQWQGAQPSGVTIYPLGGGALTNHGADRKFQQRVAAALQADPVDATIGFNKMPGLDVYFAGDGAYVAGRADPSWWEALTPRFRHRVASEQAVFGHAASTQILLLNEQQQQQYLQYYPGAASRMHVMPPAIDPSRTVGEDRAAQRRQTRAALGLQEGELALLFAGTDCHNKGFDRVLAAATQLRDTQPAQRFQLLVLGAPASRRNRRLVRRAGLKAQCHFLGGRDDVLDVMLASDLLLHPAREEAGGIVLLEAIAVGLPVITTDVCGYSAHVAAAEAGRVLVSPFSQADLNKALARYLDGVLRAECRDSALAYARSMTWHSSHARIAKIIESCCAAVRT